MKKKLLLPIFALAITGSLVACGGNNDPVSSSDTASSQDSGSSGGGSTSSEAPEPTGATAIGNYVGADVSERTEILGALEKYAVDNNIAGLPLYEDGGYTMYQNRVVKGVQEYITGYGFGILRSGRLNGELTGDVGKEKPTYYHTYSSSDPATVNAWDNDGSQVSDLMSYMSAGYYGTKDAADGKSYEWIPILATKARPWIVENAGTENETAREATANDSGYTWRIYVRTNDEGATYRTNSAMDNRKAFDGRKIALEDYLTPWKIMLTGSIGFYRGDELAGQTGRYGIKGAAEYYAATRSGGINDELFASTVGVKVGTDEVNGDYIQFEVLAPTTRFYAMYAFSDSLYQPLPMDFWKLVTNDGADTGNWYSYSSDMSTSPIDNSLSVGPYYLEEWQQNTLTTFAKNTAWTEIDPATGAARTGIYNIPGVYIRVITAATQDANTGIQQFLAGNIDACGLPLDYVDEYKSDPRTVKVPGSSVWKLNVNSCTQEEWISKFGENGSVSHTAVADYYECKPWMSNDDFIKGLFFALDRETFASSRGYVSSIDYFSSIYMSDPEGGVSYNTTDAHARALEDFWGDTVETGGYSLSLAHEFFNAAIDDLLADGSIKAGDVLNVTIGWQAESQFTSVGNEIINYFETAFNGAERAVSNNITLDVTQYAPTVWSDMYYKHLMVGQFDLGFGSISGNSLDPLNFMEVLKSDNSSGFCLNWGPDTSAVGVEYDDQLWSFDALWAAADHGICTYKGAEVAPVSVDSYTTSVNAETKDLTLTIDYTSGNKFLADKASEEDVKKIIDSGQYDGRLTGFEILDQNGALMDIQVEFDVEKGEYLVYDALNEVTNPTYVSVTWDQTNETVVIDVKASVIEEMWDWLEAYYAYYYSYAYNIYYSRAIAAGYSEEQADAYAAPLATSYAESQRESLVPTGIYGYVYSSQTIGDLESSPTSVLPTIDCATWEPVAEEDPSSSSSASVAAAI